MEIYNKYVLNKSRIAYYYPWGFFWDGICINKDGSLQKTIQFRGNDLDSVTQEEMKTIVARFNNILKRFSSKWSVSIDCIRKRIGQSDINKDVEYIATKCFEYERTALFNSGEHFDSKYYITINYLPEQELISKVGNVLVNKKNNTKEDKKNTNDTGYIAKEHIEFFKAEINNFFELIKNSFTEAKYLTESEMLSYYHTCVSDTDQKVNYVPDGNFFIDSFLSDCEVVGGIEPEIGENHIRIIAILQFPGESFPGMLDALNRTNVEYRWNTRYMALDKLEALKLLDIYHGKWYQGRKSFKQLMMEAFTKKESTHINLNAEIKANEVKEVKIFVESDDVGLGFYTTNIIVSGKDLDKVEEDAQEVRKLINSLGFTAQVERTNTLDAWLGSLPGNTTANCRRPPMHTLTLAHLLPLSAVWAGNDRNKHLDGPALIKTETTGKTPFFLNLHYGDVGHTFIVGPTGTGKSVLLNTIAANFLKYKGAQIFTFDKGASSKALAYSCGGDFFDLGVDDMSFQPFSNIDDQNEKEWANEWILDVIEQENVEITPEVKMAVSSAMESLSQSPKHHRTLQNFKTIVNNILVKDALGEYIDGSLKKYFTSDKNFISNNKIITFEMETVMEKKVIVRPLLNYLFHQLELKLDGSPTLILLDECWLFFDNPKFAEKIREWLKVFRKKNASVVFATQSLNDVAKSTIKDAVLESCYTRIYLANSNALSDENIKVYQDFDLNKKEISIIANMTPKLQYYYKSPHGSRLFQLNLSSFELAFVGVSGVDDVSRVTELGKEAKDPKEFVTQWLGYLDQKKELKIIERRKAGIFTDGEIDRDVEYFEQIEKKFQKYSQALNRHGTINEEIINE